MKSLKFLLIFVVLLSLSAVVTAQQAPLTPDQPE